MRGWSSMSAAIVFPLQAKAWHQRTAWAETGYGCPSKTAVGPNISPGPTKRSTTWCPSGVDCVSFTRPRCRTYTTSAIEPCRKKNRPASTSRCCAARPTVCRSPGPRPRKRRTCWRRRTIWKSSGTVRTRSARVSRFRRAEPMPGRLILTSHLYPFSVTASTRWLGTVRPMLPYRASVGVGDWIRPRIALRKAIQADRFSVVLGVFQPSGLPYRDLACGAPPGVRRTNARRREGSRSA